MSFGFISTISLIQFHYVHALYWDEMCNCSPTSEGLAINDEYGTDYKTNEAIHELWGCAIAAGGAAVGPLGAWVGKIINI